MPKQPTLTDFFKATSTAAGRAEDEPSAKRPREELPGTVLLDCRKVFSKRRRTRAEVAAEPIRVHRDARFKLRVVEYSKQYGVNVAAAKFKVSPGSIAGQDGWEAQEACGDVVRLKPVLIWKGEPNGKIKRDLQALKKQNACKGIEQTVTTKGKNNEAAMIFIVRETLMGTIPFGKDEKGVYAVDGAPCHMHVSVCRVFRSPHVSMPLFIGPPNGTPYAQACDKPRFNGTFKGELEEEYAMWAEENIMGRTKKQGPVPQPSRKEVANWVVRAFAAITDDATREACRTAYFPSGLRLSQLADTEFFKKHDPESDFDDGSQTDTDDAGDSDDSSGVDDSDSDDDRECDVVWAKSGRGVWGLCHVFEDTLYLTRDLMEDSAVPSNMSIPR